MTGDVLIPLLIGSTTTWGVVTLWLYRQHRREQHRLEAQRDLLTALVNTLSDQLGQRERGRFTIPLNEDVLGIGCIRRPDDSHYFYDMEKESPHESRGPDDRNPCRVTLRLPHHGQ